MVADSFDSAFAPLSHRLPRCLFPLANRPLIDYTLAALSTSGAVSEVFVYCTSHAQGGISIDFQNIGPILGLYYFELTVYPLEQLVHVTFSM